MKRLMVSPLTGKIYLTSVKDMGNGNFLSTGKQEDYTDEAIRAVFEWFMHQIKNAENANGYTIRYKGIPYVLSMTAENPKQKESEQ